MTQNNYGVRILAVVALITFLLVAGLSYQYLTGTGRGRRNLVGVISLDQPIISSDTASVVSYALDRAITNDSIKAVVLRIDSPGGYSHLIEQIYLDILELKQRKPVVASVVTALSGGYYIAVAADYIYTHPTSMVGNVGVIGIGPPTVIPSETTLESGPYKITGFSKLLFPFNLSHALDSFVSAVEDGRGSRLKLSSVELKRGMIYLGSEAVEAGLVDEVGSLQRAAAHAAEDASLVDYEIVDIGQPVERAVFGAYGNGTEVAWRDITVETLNRLNPPPAVYYIYLPPGGELQSLEQPEEPSVDQGPDADVAGRGIVVVDLSHGNKVSAWELDILMAELAKRNVVLGFATAWDDVESALESASSLIIAAPTEPYSSAEGETIEEFVSDGRLLLLFSDPASQYLEVPALHGPVNSVAKLFGLSFAKGYLYSEDEHYGLYRNIYVRHFENTSLTRGLESVVLFTSTHIRSSGGSAALTTGATYSSTAERSGSFTPIALMEMGNGTVAAFGDLTFMVEPYCYVEDNYDLILNIVSTVIGVEVPTVEEEIEHEITELDLPVGTEKTFVERIDGEEQEVRWIRVSENETLEERPDATIHYHFDVNGSLVWWETDGMKAVYNPPRPGTPYPLVEGMGWAYRSGYNLTTDGEVIRGMLTANSNVVGFEKIEAEDGETYFCAKVKKVLRDMREIEESNITRVVEGYSWLSKAGLIKVKDEARWYADGDLAKEQKREMILTSIRKGES